MIRNDSTGKVGSVGRLLAEPPDSPRTTHQFVAETLKRAILSGELPAGARLIQADLARELKVSTTPVREALRDLVGIGLIGFDAHRGAVVKGIDIDELLEIYELRRLLEPYSMRRAAENITDQELRAAAVVHEQLEDASDSATWVDLNWKFHRLLNEAARSPHLLDLVQSMQTLAGIYVAHSLKLNPERMSEGNTEHLAILNALKERDGDRAAEILIEHLNGTLAAVLAIHGDNENDRSDG